MSDRDVVIRVQNVSKKFNRGLMQSIQYGIADIARNVVGLPAHSAALRPGEFWALDDVSFEVRRGEAIGLIGPNGAGKSTLLKLLNGIIAPDRGKIEVRGRVGTLIEVGAGFHPMLTGRENIYVNGAILGMSRREIDRELESIIEFADIGEFIDVPVKFYSSGMHVRLGFAVAVHTNPDILLIDEILAVGDLSFRFKCLGKMRNLREQGVTIIFVSHSMDSVVKMCDRAIYLNQGRVHTLGSAEEAVLAYEQHPTFEEQYLRGSGEVSLVGVTTRDENNEETEVYAFGDTVKIEICFALKRPICNPRIDICLINQQGIVCVWAKSCDDGLEVNSLGGSGSIELVLPNLRLTPGAYWIDIAIFEQGSFTMPLFVHKRAKKFRIDSSKRKEGIYFPQREWRIVLG